MSPAPLSFMVPQTEWKPTPVSQLPSWDGAARVSIDLETHDPLLSTLGPGVRRGAYVCGIAFHIEDGPAHYLPIRHSEDNLPEEHVWAYLKDQSDKFRGLVVGANLQYDLDFLWEKGLLFPRIKGYRDIQVAEPLLDELQDSYRLDAIAQRYEMPGKDVAVLNEAILAYGVSKKDGMRAIPGRFAAPYAIQDVRLPTAILRRQERRLEEQDLGRVWDLECRLLPALLRMKRRGVLIDQSQLQKVEDWSIEQQQKAVELIRLEVGIRMSLDDFNKANALVAPLVAIGVKKEDIPLTPKTKVPSIDNEMLRKLKHPVADAILRARKMSKLRSTFVESIRSHMTGGRVHTTFNQLRRTSDDDEDEQGARYGRISCTDPNLQQQPSPEKDPEVGGLWRSIYIPDPGMQWAMLDYSQQEPRMLIHYAELCGCPRAREAADKYRSDPRTDNHTAMAQLLAGQDSNWVPDKQTRSRAKIIFLGLAYSMGGAKLCRQMGLPTSWWQTPDGKMVEVAGDEGRAILKQFNQQVPFVKDLAQKCEARAQEKGFITTILGRRCRFPELVAPNPCRPQDKYDYTHKALNRLIQGSSGDQTKMAVVVADEAGHALQLQVHDELDLSVRDRAHAEEVAKVMRTCVPLRLPSKVDVELGESWGRSK